VNAPPPAGSAVSLAKLVSTKLFKQEYCEWLATVEPIFYHAQLAFRKSKPTLKLLNLYDHF